MGMSGAFQRHFLPGEEKEGASFKLKTWASLQVDQNSRKAYDIDVSAARSDNGIDKNQRAG
jgi:hypothetical protein